MESNLIREYRERLISDVVTGQIDVRSWKPGPDDPIADNDFTSLAGIDTNDGLPGGEETIEE